MSTPSAAPSLRANGSQPSTLPISTEDDTYREMLQALDCTIAQLEAIYAERAQGAPDDVFEMRRKVQDLQAEMETLTEERETLQQQVESLKVQTASFRVHAHGLIRRLTQAALEAA